MDFTPKHERIIQAGTAVFAQYGYKKTTVDEIVSAAGISKGLFYHYYENKKALYIHLYDLYAELLSQTVRQDVDTQKGDFFARLREIAQSRLAFIKQYPQVWGFLYSAYYEQHPDVAPDIAEKNQTLLLRSETGSAAGIDWSSLRRDITPQQALDLVTWVTEGYVRQVNALSITTDSQRYAAFDTYLNVLKIGMLDPNA